MISGLSISVNYMDRQDVKGKVIVVLNRLYFWLAIVFFISLQIAFRFFVGFATIGMLAVALTYHKLDTGKWWNRSFFNPFVLGCFLYFAVQTFALVYTRNIEMGLCIFQTNLGLIALPVAVSYSNLVNKKSWGRLMKWYSMILFGTTTIALTYAMYLFLRTGNSAVFFITRLS